MPRPALLAATTTILALVACGGPGNAKRPYAPPTVPDLLARLAATRDQVPSFNAETTMDYWMNGQRVKGGVLVMGTAGSKVRINAQSPAGDAVIADLACNGQDYTFLDFQKDCQLAGPCSKDTIASLFNIALAPDDFVQLAVGATPVVAGATGTVRWDPKAGKEVLELTGTDGRSQTIVLDATNGRADVLSSEVKTAAGAQEWRIDNTDFTTVKDERGMARRVPGKSRFRSPGKEADLLVTWKERRLGLELADDKFQLEVPGGLGRCQ